MSDDRRARRLTRQLAEPPFTSIVDYCGSDARPGIDEAQEWQVWTNRGTTPDQAAIEEVMERLVQPSTAIFHVGVGNSSLARRFSNRVAQIYGITLHHEEKSIADSLNISHYLVSVTNKYSNNLAEISKSFDIIVDNNPASFACCLFHFCRMMSNYAMMLCPGGQILTAQPGLGWTLSVSNPGWSLGWKDWARLGDALSLRARQLTSAVYSMEKPQRGAAADWRTG